MKIESFKLRVDKKYLGFIIILLINNRFFYLIPSSITQFFGLKYADFEILCLLVYSLAVIFRYGLIYTRGSCKFIGLVVFTFVLAFSGAAVSANLFGQSFIQGFLAQRILFMLPFMYYAIRLLFKNKVFEWGKISDILFKFALIEICVISLQAVLYNYVSFIELTGSTNSRVALSAVRYSIACPYGIFVLDKSIREIIGSKGLFRKVKYFVVLFVYMFFLICVVQTRALVIGNMVALAIYILFNREKISNKITLLLLGIIMLIAFFNTDLGQYFLTAVTGSVYDDSTNVREIGRSYYISQIKLSPIFGRGFPHEDSIAAYSAAGVYDAIYLNDNGVFAFVYMYGLIGLVWYIAFHIKMARFSFSIIKNNGISIFLFYTVLLIATCITLIFWYWQIQSAFILALMLAGMESKYQNMSACFDTIRKDRS